MKRFSALVLAMMLAPVFILAGCEEKINSTQKKQPASFLNLIQAYEDGRVFSSAEIIAGNCTVKFEDGFDIKVPQSEISVKDHSASQPPVIKTSSGWWSVGTQILPIKVDVSLPDRECFPVYVYFDK